MRERICYDGMRLAILRHVVIFLTLLYSIGLFFVNVLSGLVMSLILGVLFVLSSGFYFNSIYLTPEEITYHRKTHQWEDIRITLYYTQGQAFRGYQVLFGNHYYFTEDMLKKQKPICKVWLNDENISAILKYYPHKFYVLDTYRSEVTSELKVSLKIQKKIKEHNQAVSLREGDGV